MNLGCLSGLGKSPTWFSVKSAPYYTVRTIQDKTKQYFPIILSYPSSLSYSILYCTLLYYTRPNRESSTVYRSIPYHTIPYPLLYSTLLYSTLLYSTLLYYTMLYNLTLPYNSLIGGHVQRLPNGLLGLVV